MAKRFGAAMFGSALRASVLVTSCVVVAWGCVSRPDAEFSAEVTRRSDGARTPSELELPFYFEENRGQFRHGDIRLCFHLRNNEVSIAPKLARIRRAAYAGRCNRPRRLIAGLKPYRC